MEVLAREREIRRKYEMGGADGIRASNRMRFAAGCIEFHGSQIGRIDATLRKWVR